MKGQREAIALKKAITKSKRKTMRSIIEELGSRNISLNDIASYTSDNPAKNHIGFLDMLSSTGATLDDALILQQYAKAITQQDTRAAEFIRDTKGEKPSTCVDVQATSTTGLSQMSLEDLLALKSALESANQDSEQE